MRALLAGSVILAAGFVAAEQRAAQPMLPLRLFANTTLSAAVATRFALFAAIFGCAFLMPWYLQLARGFSPLSTGLGVLPFTGPLMLIAPSAGRLAGRHGERVVMAAGFACTAAGFALLGLTITNASTYPGLPGPLLAGTGVALAVPTTVSASLRAVPATRSAWPAASAPPSRTLAACSASPPQPVFAHRRQLPHPLFSSGSRIRCRRILVRNQAASRRLARVMSEARA
ncbi:MAG: hypothetical protein ACRDOK_06180 [Streptosporangiaceae bacterium]